MIITDTDGLGRVEVATVPMPAFAKGLSATYTYSGKVVVFYHKDDDPKQADYFNIAVVNDDGTDFRTIFAGVIPEHKTANGIRHMPFADNKRILLGDYVLECSPDIDHCHKAELAPIRYPWELESDPRTMKHWSEIIIAPDNKHMAWTILGMGGAGAANALGILKRDGDSYIIDQPQIISTMAPPIPDKDHPGCVILQPMRGGEVKQFVKGGTAISLVGAKDGATPDSVVQDLLSGEMTRITRTPGYDETTIFSPDERLGMVMSTRGSKRTDPAIFGLLPRPYASFVVMSLTWHIYMYAVAGVRSFRKGNIGPVLIDIQRSMHEPGYRGVVLNDPAEEWVYVSPMSWHPGGKTAMWLEMVRGSDSFPGGRRMRIRKATLLDYQPGPPVPVQRTPDNIPYAITGEQARLSLWASSRIFMAGKIAGKHTGHMELDRRDQRQDQDMGDTVESRYVNFSDDGRTFYNGFERANFSFMGESQYQADLEMRGEQEGAMKCRVTFSAFTFHQPPKLLFDRAADGKPKSYGYAEYNGVRLNVEDMLE